MAAEEGGGWQGGVDAASHPVIGKDHALRNGLMYLQRLGRGGGGEEEEDGQHCITFSAYMLYTHVHVCICTCICTCMYVYFLVRNLASSCTCMYMHVHVYTCFGIKFSILVASLSSLI